MRFTPQQKAPMPSEKVTVEVDEAGTIYTGTASHTDVLEASARAYIAALNEREIIIGSQQAVDFATTGIMESFGAEE